MVLADTIDEETGREIPVSPRTILKRQVARAADAGFAIKAGSEFEFYVLQGLVGGAGRARLAGAAARSATTTRTTTSCRRPRRSRSTDLLRNQMTAAERPDRVQQGRGGQRPARGQHPLRPRPRVGRPERRLQARRQGDRLPQRLGHHVHGQARPPLDGLVRPPAHERLGRGEGRAADARDRPREARALRPVEGRPAVHGRDDGAVTRAGRVHRPVHQLVQALRLAVVGAGQRRLGPGQPDDRLPPRRAAARRSTSRTASRAAT